jgi:hypothetical protein
MTTCEQCYTVQHTYDIYTITNNLYNSECLINFKLMNDSVCTFANFYMAVLLIFS